jgi:hypothetical protein
MAMMRRYKEAVVKASAPRDFKPGSEVDPKQARRLRDHRQKHADITDPETGLEPLRQRLKALDCKFILGNETSWRVRDADWELKVWKPLFDWVEEGYGMLFRDRQSPKTIPAQELRNWDDKELNLEYHLMSRMLDFMPENGDPIMDEGSLSVRWRDEECFLGNTQQYALMTCLIKETGRYVPYDSIRTALGDDIMSDPAIRKNVERLRTKLKESHCDRLADAIDTSQKEHVRLDLVKLKASGFQREK